MLPTTVTASDLQRLFNVTSARISQLAAEGVIVRGKKKGQYLLVNSAQNYTALLRSRAAPSPMNDQRQRWLAAKADMAERERDHQAGELVPVRDVEAAWAAIVSTLRMRLLSVPAHLSARCDPATRASFHAFATEYINSVLQELSDTEVEAT